MSRMESLSPKQARKLVLHSQKLPFAKQKDSAISATQSAIDHLGYIQIDTISVIERAHHHTLWNRNPHYTSGHLDLLLEEKSIFEYWSHAAAYLPMRDFRFSLVRKQAMASGEIHHWYECDRKLMDELLERIREEGPLMSRDFENSGDKTGEWHRKPAKKALENLFMQGELMIPYRKNFQKVYDLTERVLPDGVDTSVPDQEEYGRFLVSSYLRANGIGQAAEMVYLLKNTRNLIKCTLQEMVEDGEVLPVEVCKKQYYVLPQSLALLKKPLRRSRVKILSPFDNLLIQRERMRTLFNFDYLLECYVPARKRKYGYFVLPILWNGKLAARMDCRAERKKKILHIHNLVLEPGVKAVPFADALKKELIPFLSFNNCRSRTVHRCVPAALCQLLHGDEL